MLSPRQEVFATLVAAGTAPADACIAAGYAPGRARQTAAALLGRPRVAARVRVLAPTGTEAGPAAPGPASDRRSRRKPGRSTKARTGRKAGQKTAPKSEPGTAARPHGACDADPGPGRPPPIAELAVEPGESGPTDRGWVLGMLRLVVGRCLSGEPVLDRGGQPTGGRSSNVTGAIRALELIGRELGMFGERDGAPPTPFAEASDAELDAAIRRLGGEAGFEIRPRRAGAPAGGEPAGAVPPLSEAD